MEQIRGLRILWNTVWAPLFLWVEEAGSHRLLLVRASRSTLGFVGKYATKIVVPYFRASSIIGYLLLLTIVAQMYSGFLLALIYLPDPSFVIFLRTEFFAEVWWYAYFYRMHVVGVDLIFVFSYAHIAKKLYLRNYATGDVDGWLTGGYAFLLYHLVVFLGITLSTNHLGDVTVTIGANIFWSLLARWHKTYTPFFTNKHLNVDQLTRFMIAHYISAYLYTFFVQLHVMYIHEMWDADSDHSAHLESSSPKISWLWDALMRENLLAYTAYCFFFLQFLADLFPVPYVVSIMFFEQWSEAEVEDINFFIVGPHWYFRPHMGLLTVCAQHYEGLFWLGAFYGLLTFMPHLYRLIGGFVTTSALAEPRALRYAPAQQAFFAAFIASLLYVGGTLPCGRFYYESFEGFTGNAWLRVSYQYLYVYLGYLAHVGDRFDRFAHALVSSFIGLLHTDHVVGSHNSSFSPDGAVSSALEGGEADGAPSAPVADDDLL